MLLHMLHRDLSLRPGTFWINDVQLASDKCVHGLNLSGCIKCWRPIAGKVKLTDTKGSSHESCLLNEPGCLRIRGIGKPHAMQQGVGISAALTRVNRTPASMSARSGAGLG